MCAREWVLREVDRYAYGFDEAVEVDSRSMYAEVRRFLAEHPEIKSLLVVSGASHANDMERYAGADE